MTDRKCLSAHTATGANYPAYVNFTLVGDEIEVTVREAAKADGACGATVAMRMGKGKFFDMVAETVCGLTDG